MTTTLITGANKGLGLETARQLVAAGHTVYIGSRDAELGRHVAEQLGARAIRLDITAMPAAIYPGVAYPASKAAVNMITAQYAKAFPNMRINAVDPGFTKTDLNGNTGIQSVEQGADIIVRMAQVDPDGPTGGFFNTDGAVPGELTVHCMPCPSRASSAASDGGRPEICTASPRVHAHSARSTTGARTVAVGSPAVARTALGASTAVPDSPGGPVHEPTSTSQL
jgi:hypothetical protein